MAEYMGCHVLPTVTRSNLCPRPRFSLPDPLSLFSRSLPGPSLTLSSLWSPCVAMPSLFQAAGWHCCEVWRRILLGAPRPGKLMMGDHRDPPWVPSKPSMVSRRHKPTYLATTNPTHPSIWATVSGRPHLARLKIKKRIFSMKISFLPLSRLFCSICILYATILKSHYWVLSLSPCSGLFIYDPCFHLTYSQLAWPSPCIAKFILT